MNLAIKNNLHLFPFACCLFPLFYVRCLADRDRYLGFIYSVTLYNMMEKASILKTHKIAKKLKRSEFTHALLSKSKIFFK